MILLDLNLPKKDGREALAEIKADPELRGIPVVILTTSNAEEDVLRTYSLGASSAHPQAGEHDVAGRHHVHAGSLLVRDRRTAARRRGRSGRRLTAHGREDEVDRDPQPDDEQADPGRLRVGVETIQDNGVAHEGKDRRRNRVAERAEWPRRAQAACVGARTAR